MRHAFGDIATRFFGKHLETNQCRSRCEETTRCCMVGWGRNAIVARFLSGCGIFNGELNWIAPLPKAIGPSRCRWLVLSRRCRPEPKMGRLITACLACSVTGQSVSNAGGLSMLIWLLCSAQWCSHCAVGLFNNVRGGLNCGRAVQSQHGWPVYSQHG